MQRTSFSASYTYTTKNANAENTPRHEKTKNWITRSEVFKKIRKRIKELDESRIEIIAPEIEVNKRNRKT